MSSRASTRVSVAFICPHLCEMGGTVSRPGTQDEGPSPEQDGGLLPSACVSPELQLLLRLSVQGSPRVSPQPSAYTQHTNRLPTAQTTPPVLQLPQKETPHPPNLPHPMQMDGVISTGLKPPECTQDAT